MSSDLGGGANAIVPNNVVNVADRPRGANYRQLVKYVARTETSVPPRERMRHAARIWQEGKGQAGGPSYDVVSNKTGVPVITRVLF